MSQAAFDTLDYFERLRDAGVPDEQASAQTEALKSFLARHEDEARAEMATKTDIRESELRLQKEIETVRADVKNTELRLQKEIEKLRVDMKNTELRLKYDLTVRLGAIVVACTAILLAVLPMFSK